MYNQFDQIEGDLAEGVALIEFPSADEARAWYDSEEYQKIQHLRTENSRFINIIVEAGFAARGTEDAGETIGMKCKGPGDLNSPEGNIRSVAIVLLMLSHLSLRCRSCRADVCHRVKYTTTSHLGSFEE